MICMGSKLLKKIERLSVDKNFGILTRNALDEIITNKKKPFDCLFIDLHNIKKLNNLLGYGKVNSLIKSCFADLQSKDECVIGRWFGGDEILFLSEDIDMTSLKLKQCCIKYNLSYKEKTFNNIHSIKHLESLINNI